jgi:hypothetical protein
MLALILPILVSAGRNLKISFTADNVWSMNITGFPTLSGSDWTDANLVEKNLTGSGPWVVTVSVYNSFSYAGFFAGVQLDGVNFDSTGSANTKWAISVNKPPSDWTSPSFDDSTWVKNFASATDCLTICETAWNAYSLTTRLSAQIGNQEIHGIWYPMCSTSNDASFQYFRLVIPSQASTPIISDLNANARCRVLINQYNVNPFYSNGTLVLLFNYSPVSL